MLFSPGGVRKHMPIQDDKMDVLSRKDKVCSSSPTTAWSTKPWHPWGSFHLFWILYAHSLFLIGHCFVGDELRLRGSQSRLRRARHHARHRNGAAWRIRKSI